jgi:hypothetical protein
VILCPTDQSALERFEAVKSGPNLIQPAKNGRLVMDFAMWGDDTREMAAKVLSTFASFDGGAPLQKQD